MNTKHSKLIGILLTVALFLTAAVMLVACGEKNVVSEIYITKADMPRTE